MKRFISLFFVIIASYNISAQDLGSFNYQAIIRDANGNVQANTNVTIAIEILQGSTSGATVYNETHTTSTNAYGLVTLQIGSINPSNFSTINWSNTPFFLKISVDGTIIGISQLMSVPLAIHAKEAEIYSETDPVFLAHPANGITSTNLSNWNAAYIWGNHANAGYLTSFTEADPVFGAAAAKNITASNITNWNSAYSWGNHANAGYLTSFTEVDPAFGASAASGITLTSITNWNATYGWGNHASAGYLTSFTETDPVFGASAANGINSTNITNWNTAYGWGNHAGLYKLTSYIPDWSEITNNPFSISSPLNNQLLKYDNTSSKWENWTPNFLTTETQSLTLISDQLSISGAGGNTVTFTNWDTDKTDDVTLTTPTNGDMLYFNGTSWTAVPKGTTGQVLTMNASGVPEWQYTYTAPTASTQPATFSLPAAILNGVVNPNKLSTTVTFQYGTTISYGSTATATQSPVIGSSNTNVSCSVSGLVAGTTYHFRVKAENSFGITYGDDMTFTLLGNGITWEGGLIFYLDATGQHGLVAASSDQASTDWGCYPSVITGADGTAVGTGNQNTLDIVAGCATIGIAAEICSSLSLNGYSDWFLPSKDELGLMYTNLHLAGKGSFGTTLFYWSSSEYNINYSYRLNFSGGVSGTSLKNSTQYVRAVRVF